MRERYTLHLRYWIVACSSGVYVMGVVPFLNLERSRAIIYGTRRLIKHVYRTHQSGLLSTIGADCFLQRTVPCKSQATRVFIASLEIASALDHTARRFESSFDRLQTEHLHHGEQQVRLRHDKPVKLVMQDVAVSSSPKHCTKSVTHGRESRCGAATPAAVLYRDN